MKTVLIASPNPTDSRAITQAFSDEDRIDIHDDWQAILTVVKHQRYDFAFIDIQILGNYAQDKVKQLLQLSPSLKILVITALEELRLTMRGIKAGAKDYISRPVSKDEILLVTSNVDETLKLESELDFLRDEFWRTDVVDGFRSDCPAMQEVLRKARSVALTKSTVLLTGETGTGKGVLARLIHRHSQRSDNQFISIHCGAIPDTLLESELFGHEKGAFTGASRRKLGKFEIADKGTIFLDEIGTISHSAQIKLLQVLQDQTFQRLGSEKTFHCDLRIIAATNVDLWQLCNQGLFRKDLYYRLNVFPLTIPPLRDRRQDIPHLTNQFIHQLSHAYSKEVTGIHTDVLSAFNNYEWPGNIRELENLIERAFVLEDSEVLTPDSFPGELFDPQGLNPQTTIDIDSPLAEARATWVCEGELHYLTQLLDHTQGKVAQAASKAGITSRQLNTLMRKHNLKKESFKKPTKH